MNIKLQIRMRAIARETISVRTREKDQLDIQIYVLDHAQGTEHAVQITVYEEINESILVLEDRGRKILDMIHAVKGVKRR